MSEQKDRAVIWAPDQTQPSTIRAKHFKVISAGCDFQQFGKAIQAFMEAGLPFEMIANAGESLGYEVQRGEMDAPLSQAVGQLKSIGEIVEDHGATMAWQGRGEVIEISPQIAAPISGQELTVTSQAVSEVANSAQREVLEGIAVMEQKQPTLASPNDELLSNPYLQAPASLKKAA